MELDEAQLEKQAVPLGFLDYIMSVLAIVPLFIFRCLQWLKHNKGSFYLKGIFAPVRKEIEAKDLPVEGEIPDGVQGIYIRTGPNPQHDPIGAYHWFDGEAMIHAIHFDEGRAKSYNNHWLRTSQYYIEKKAGKNVFIRAGDQMGPIGLVLVLFDEYFGWVWRPRKLSKLDLGPVGNTALVYHDSKLLSLMEAGFPFLLKVCKGVVSSIGKYTFGGTLDHAFTAHPKIDPNTGEMLAFVYNPAAPESRKDEWVRYFTIDAEGKKTPSIPVDVQAGQMMHDFAITKNFAIFMDHALVFDGSAMVRDGGLPFKNELERPSRIGLLRRADPTAPIVWYEVPPFICFHTANAWEEDQYVHLACCKYEYLDLNGGADGNFDTKRASNAPPTRYSINTVTKEVTVTNLVHDISCDFPVVPAPVVARHVPARYMYAAVMPDKTDGTMTGVLKVDMFAGENGGRVAQITYPVGYAGGEMAFVARDKAAMEKGRTEEDDGYLLGYVTDKNTMKSYCMIFDAMSMSSEPVAKIELPQRVPAGFHGLFVPQEDLDHQDLTAPPAA